MGGSTTGTGSTGTGSTSGASSTSGTTGSTCTDACSAGETQCAGSQLQTCEAGDAGCLIWSGAANCSTDGGWACDPVLNACVPTCNVNQIQSDCDSAVAVINGCCAGGFAPLTGALLCSQEIQAGNDPDQQCQSLSGDSCSTINSLYFDVGICCCEAGDYCDEETSNWTCTQVCTSGTSSSCYCAPNDDGSELVDSPFICKADDGAAYHACVGLTVTCSSPYDCWTTSYGEFCTNSCNVDSDCGDTGVACCDTSGVSCSNDFGGCAASGACLPCGSF
jgi:hypothetical protein